MELLKIEESRISKRGRLIKMKKCIIYMIIMWVISIFRVLYHGMDNVTMWGFTCCFMLSYLLWRMRDSLPW